MSPDESARRKSAGRDKYERDLGLLARVRDSYLRQAASGWVRIDAERPREVVAAEVFGAVERKL
jgi:thymidylate kinase